MNSAYIACFMILMIIIIIHSRNERLVSQIIRRKRRKEGLQMKLLAQKFINKQCLIYTFQSQITGVIKEIGDSGLLVDSYGAEEIINFDYIIRIREYPKNKKGKKKALILD